MFFLKKPLDGFGHSVHFWPQISSKDQFFLSTDVGIVSEVNFSIPKCLKISFLSQYKLEYFENLYLKNLVYICYIVYYRLI